MKKNINKVIAIDIILVLFGIFHFFISKSFNQLYYTLELLLITIIVSFLLRNKVKHERFNNELILIILITLIFYYVITYFLGFFTGFFYTTYSKSIMGIIKNVSLSALFIVVEEVLREKIVKNGDLYKWSVYLVPFIFSLIEIPLVFNFHNITTNKDMLDVLISVVLPYLSKNIFLTYAVFKSNKISTLIYQMVMQLPVYVLPIFPNLGDYFTTIFNVLLPILLLVLSINIMTIKREKVENSRTIIKERTIRLIITLSLSALMIGMVYITSGVFRFYGLAIGSESMTGTINKGDIVIIDQKECKVEKGKVIAFQEQGKIIVHRVERVIDEKQGLYKTKGDFNNAEDGWILDKRNVIGEVKFTIKFLGWPTVALSELIN